MIGRLPNLTNTCTHPHNSPAKVRSTNSLHPVLANVESYQGWARLHCQFCVQDSTLFDAALLWMTVASAPGTAWETGDETHTACASAIRPRGASSIQQLSARPQVAASGCESTHAAGLMYCMPKAPNFLARAWAYGTKIMCGCCLLIVWPRRGSLEDKLM